MSVFIVVQAIRTSRAGRRRLIHHKIDNKLNLYEEYEPAALVSEVVPASYVLLKSDIKNRHYIQDKELKAMADKAAKHLNNSNN
jgi:hypothetical protein